MNAGIETSTGAAKLAIAFTPDSPKNALQSTAGASACNCFTGILW